MSSSVGLSLMGAILQIPKIQPRSDWCPHKGVEMEELARMEAPGLPAASTEVPKIHLIGKKSNQSTAPTEIVFFARVLDYVGIWECLVIHDVPIWDKNIF